MNTFQVMGALWEVREKVASSLRSAKPYYPGVSSPCGPQPPCTHTHTHHLPSPSPSLPLGDTGNGDHEDCYSHPYGAARLGVPAGAYLGSQCPPETGRDRWPSPPLTGSRVPASDLHFPHSPSAVPGDQEPIRDLLVRETGF